VTEASVGTLQELLRRGNTEEFGESPITVSLCPPQIPHWLTRYRNRVSAVRSRLLLPVQPHGPSDRLRCNAYLFKDVCFLWCCGRTRAMASSFLRFLDHTQRRTTVGRTPLDKWSARSRDLYLTTHNTDNRQTTMPPVGFEPTISAGERPQTNALDRAVTRTGSSKTDITKFSLWSWNDATT